MTRKCKKPSVWDRWHAEAVMVHFSGFLVPVCSFSCFRAGHVSSLFKSGGFLCPCLLAGGQRGRGRGSRWGMVSSICLSLKPFTCLFSCLCSSPWELGDFSEKWWSELLTVGDQGCFLFSGVPSGVLDSFFWPEFGLWQNAQQGQSSVQMAKICQIHWK